MSYNKIILSGNLVRDIEIKYTQGGSAIGNTAIATTKKYTSASGEKKEEVCFIDITFFGKMAENANKYLKKGSQILIDGRLKQDQWTAQDGSKRSRHSVTVETLQMLDSKGEAKPIPDAPSAPSQPAPSQPAPGIPEIDVNEDEIPF